MMKPRSMMQHLSPLLIATGLCLAHLFPAVVAAAPARQPARPASTARPASPQSKPHQASLAGGRVLINAITRNDSASKVAVVLATEGQARLPIIIAEKAPESIKAVAADLAQYLGRITGGTFEVKTGDGTAGIVLGSLEDFPTPALARALEIRNGFDGREAYAIRTRAGKILLLGATPLGASHAAYRLLEELGCRWFFPHPAWEVVPHKPTLEFARDITDRPQILARSIWFEAGSGGEAQNRQYADWRRRNRQAESFQTSTGHGMFAVVRANQKEFDAHPEYYAARRQADGTLKRDPAGYQLEYANPRVRELIARYAVDYFKQNPAADMVSLEPEDTNAYSQSPEALKMGTVSDQVYGAANEAARALQKAYPGQHKMVGLLSYNSTYDPPSFRLEPNVHVQISPMGVNPRYSSEERWKLWPQRSSNLGVYEYYSVWLWSYDSLPGSYSNDVRGLQKHIRDEMVARNVISISAESTSSWGSNGRGYYVATRLLWNPDQDLKALLQDFYEQAFGPAAPAMKKYYDDYDPGHKPLMSAHLLGLLFRDLDEATRLATGRPDVLARLDQLKMYLRYIDLSWRRNNEGQQDITQDDILKVLYRQRDYALTAWEMIRQQWGGGKYPGRDEAPWMVNEPVTREEIDDNFRAAVAHYTPKIRNIGPRQEFSADLVPVRWPGVTPQMNVASNQIYQGGMTYALWSTRGEPLEFTTTASDAWGYKTSFSVTDAKGKELASGKPEAKVAVKHKITVPGPGLYFLKYHDPGAYWTFEAPAGTVATVLALPEKTGGRSARIYQDWYFYVPKGVEKIEYFMEGGSAHTVFGPDGSEQARILQVNDFVVIPVPPGMDGKLWRLNQAHFGKFHFYNVPPYFAGSPEALLVPREVAQADGLKLR